MSASILERRLSAAIIAAKVVALSFITAMFVGMAWDLAHHVKADVRLFPVGIVMVIIVQFGAWMALRKLKKRSDRREPG